MEILSCFELKELTYTYVITPKEYFFFLLSIFFQKMFEYANLLDINRIYTNNIFEMLHTYGVEAAQRAIIKEIRSVQSAYGIKVDFRHLSLLSDYFTQEGTYKACSRHAIASCSSSIQKMSYETCFSFLINSLLNGNFSKLDVYMKINN